MKCKTWCKPMHRYRVKRILFGDSGHVYDLSKLLHNATVSLAKEAGIRIRDVQGVKMTGRARVGLEVVVQYEIIANCWANEWAPGQFADIMADTLAGWSGNAEIGQKVLEEMVYSGLMFRKHDDKGNTAYAIDYKEVAEKCNMEIIPEAYKIESISE